MKYVVIGLALLASACGVGDESGYSRTTTGASTASNSGNTSTAAPTCATRSGVYRAVHTYQSGKCGPGFESNVNADGSTAGSGCQSRGSTSADQCSVTIDLLCQGTYGPFTAVGRTEWTPSGSSGSGSVSYDFRDAYGVQICQGTYGVTYQRL